RLELRLLLLLRLPLRFTGPCQEIRETPVARNEGLAGACLLLRAPPVSRAQGGLRGAQTLLRRLGVACLRAQALRFRRARPGWRRWRGHRRGGRRGGQGGGGGRGGGGGGGGGPAGGSRLRERRSGRRGQRGHRREGVTRRAGRAVGTRLRPEADVGGHTQ